MARMNMDTLRISTNNKFEIYLISQHPKPCNLYEQLYTSERIEQVRNLINQNSIEVATVVGTVLQEALVYVLQQF